MVTALSPNLSGDFVQHVLLVDEVTAALYQLEQLADVGVPFGEDLFRATTRGVSGRGG